MDVYVYSDVFPFVKFGNAKIIDLKIDDLLQTCSMADVNMLSVIAS